MKKLLSALLLLLMIGILPVCAEEAQQTFDIPVQVNPLYADVIDIENLPEVPFGGAAMLSDPEYGTAEETAAVVREYMKARVNSFTAYVKTERLPDPMDYQALVNQLFSEIFSKAMEHTGNPGEGDNLRWQYMGVGAKNISISGDNQYFYLVIPFGVTYYTTAEQEEELDIAVEELLAALSLDGKSCYQKISAIYAYITENVTYDHEGLEDNTDLLKYTAYDALINGSAVCQGYANLFYRLALEVGVDSRLIAGDGGGPHGWNIARIGNKYYNLDTTWDAEYAKYQLPYEYFLKCPANFTGHVRYEEYETESYHAAYPMAKEDFPVDQIGASGECGASICWWLTNDGTLTVSGTGKMDDYGSERDTPWYSRQDAIQKLVMEDGVNRIGDYAFYGCTNLTQIVFCDDAPEIGYSAFGQITATAYYPGNNPTWTSDKLQNYGGSITWVQNALTDVKVWNIALGDNVGVNFYVDVAQEVLAEAILRLRVDDRTWLYAAADLQPDGAGLRMIPMEVAAAQMTVPITVELMIGDEVTVLGTYTVLQYANYILTDSKNEFTDAQKNMVKAMLAYGGAAQRYFGCNTESMADDGISLTPAMMPEQVPSQSVEGCASEILYYGASLLFESKTALRYYFLIAGNLADCTFTVNGQTYAAKQKDGLYYVEIPGINPQDLDEMVALSVSCGSDSITVNYSPMHYMVRQYRTGSDSLKALLQAMYGYYLAAEAYYA